MSDKKEQEKPLAAAPYSHVDIEQTDSLSRKSTTHHWNCIKCCGCAAAIVLIIATVILVLMFTVFHIKNPILNVNSVGITGLDNSTNFGPGHNLTVEVDVSVKNPNAVSFKFVNVTTKLYYNGTIIGETTSQWSEARARRTLPVTVWIEVIVDKMFQVGGFKSDLDKRILPFRLSMRIYGKVKITNAIKRSVVLNMNCTMEVDISSQRIEDLDCKRGISL